MLETGTLMGRGLPKAIPHVFLTLTTKHHNANWSLTRTDNVESEAGPVLYVVFEGLYG